VHLTGTFNCCRHAAPHLVAAGSGAIVNTSSHAFLGVYGGTGYAAGKGGVNSLTWALARDLAEHGVRCNAVCPGARTDLSSGPDYERKVRALHRRGLLDDALLAASLDPAPPEFVAPMYAYLVSDAARDISGQVFSVSGNYVGRFPAAAEELLLYRDHADGRTWTLDELHHQLSAHP